MDKLESFSRRNNVRFFNVYEGPNEENAACFSKVVQLLNRFYSSSKTWTADDVERAHRTGPKNDSYNRPRPIVAQMAGQAHRTAAETVESRWQTPSTFVWLPT